MLNIGEKIETIILSRSNGTFGEYLGSTAKTFGAVRIDGVVYKVERPVEVNKPAYIIRNVNDGTTAIVEDKYDLPMVTEADFH